MPVGRLDGDSFGLPLGVLLSESLSPSEHGNNLPLKAQLNDLPAFFSTIAMMKLNKYVS
jgi:hypothetical protein